MCMPRVCDFPERWKEHLVLVVYIYMHCVIGQVFSRYKPKLYWLIVCSQAVVLIDTCTVYACRILSGRIILTMSSASPTHLIIVYIQCR